MNRIVKDVARGSGARFIDLLEFICPDAPACIGNVGGEELRRDGVHFEGGGARIVGKWVLDQLGAPVEPVPVPGSTPSS